MPLPAFPGAEGYGAFSCGGRGGRVYVVTTLEDYMPRERPGRREDVIRQNPDRPLPGYPAIPREDPLPGSLREAVEAEGPRIVMRNPENNVHSLHREDTIHRRKIP